MLCDLPADQLLQETVARAFTKGYVDALMAQYSKPYYTVKRALAESFLAESMPEAVSWRLPSGERGMFCWLLVNHER